MKKILSIICAALLTASCVDTVILPDNLTVEEDFWKTKGDVESMVNGAYKSMLDANVMARLIVWGDFRSDEILPNNSLSDGVATALNEINEATVQSTNTFADWSYFYVVINNCNIVLEKAAKVMENDPSYTQSDYLSDCAQVRALRALCYFYLVRAFRDVPYSEKAFMNSSQDLNIPQSSPAYVLQRCIDDLKQSVSHAPSSQGFTDVWRNRGNITVDAINSILADIYLWRGSVNHDVADYDSCVVYCDKVIASKQQLNEYKPNASYVAPGYQLYYKMLYTGKEAFDNIFVGQNSDESIFELQYDGTQNSNTSLCQYFFKYRNDASTYGYMKASPIFTGSTVYENTSDYRYWQNTFDVTKSQNFYDIRKMTAPGRWSINNPGSATAQTRLAQSVQQRTYTRFAQNYIIYRISDIMLMKAEALAEMTEDVEDPRVEEAFLLAEAINTRSLYEGNITNYKKIATYKQAGIEGIRNFIREERLRELCFEGKRWYDLMRYNYRLISGVDYNRILADIGEQNIPMNSREMRQLVVRKRSEGQDVIMNKLRTEAHLYMPIPNGDIKVCPVLKQNPAYPDADKYEKNY